MPSIPLYPVSVTKQIKFSSSHQLPDHAGKCGRMHGHTFVLEVTARGQVAPLDGSPSSGMVMDFGELGAALKRLHDECLDHRILNDFDEYPTAERLVQRIAYLLLLWFGESGRVHLEQVRLFEEQVFPACSATIGLPGKVLKLGGLPHFDDTKLCKMADWFRRAPESLNAEETLRLATAIAKEAISRPLNPIEVHMERRRKLLESLVGPESLAALQRAPDCSECSSENHPSADPGKKVEFFVGPTDSGYALVTCGGCKKELLRCPRADLTRSGATSAPMAPGSKLELPGGDALVHSEVTLLKLPPNMIEMPIDLGTAWREPTDGESAALEEASRYVDGKLAVALRATGMSLPADGAVFATSAELVEAMTQIDGRTSEGISFLDGQPVPLESAVQAGLLSRDQAQSLIPSMADADMQSVLNPNGQTWSPVEKKPAADAPTSCYCATSAHPPCSFCTSHSGQPS